MQNTSSILAGNGVVWQWVWLWTGVSLARVWDGDVKEKWWLVSTPKLGHMENHSIQNSDLSLSYPLPPIPYHAYLIHLTLQHALAEGFVPIKAEVFWGMGWVFLFNLCKPNIIPSPSLNIIVQFSSLTSNMDMLWMAKGLSLFINWLDE